MDDGAAHGFDVDLTNCDREPIHLLATIQPFGFLVALTADWLVSRASDNLAGFLGVEPGAALGGPATALFSAEAVHAIRNRLAMLRGPDAVERLFALPLRDGGPLFDVAVHIAGDAIVIEGEPAGANDVEAAGLVRSMMGRLNQTDSVTAFLREGARQVRAITGFDRVMVYRFDAGGSGEVVAETLKPGVDSFMGLNYPAADIPQQARRLYLRNIFRVIADVNAVPVPVRPALDPRGQALDQSLSVTRAVSPIHVEYLRNMGVGASLSISIVVGGKLWGLFACHHYSPRLPNFAARTAAELFGQMFSLMLESRERREAADYETRARAVTDRLMATIAQDSDLLGNASWLGEIIFETIPSDGIAVYLDGNVSLSGLSPPASQVLVLIAMLNRVASSEVFATDSISRVLPEASAYADIAAGLIAIPLSRTPRDYVILFRAERLRSVRWAGNPEKQIERGPGGDRLTPRKSFEAWSQLVKGQSLPFTDPERRVAEALRVGMLEVLVRLSDSASAERKRSTERQELLIAELNHRVRNILSLIRGLISQTKGSTETVEGFIATLEHRIQSLARAHDQITSDRWGPARLVDLIETETGAFLTLQRNRVTLDGPNVLLDPVAFTTLALVFHELMTNAAKYGALSDSGRVRIGWSIAVTGDLVITWTEEGGPAVTAPTRRGFGSTIIERSVPYDLGGTADVQYRLGGLVAKLCVPGRHVAGLAKEEAAAARTQARVAFADKPLAGRVALLVEDSMIIALDGEDALRSLGAERVVTVSTVAQALDVLARESIGFALLDFNLGTETSLAIAERLSERGTPFLFATGYGDSIEEAARFPGTAVVSKPYGPAQLTRGLAEIGVGQPAD